jgi:hypothetical protein
MADRPRVFLSHGAGDDDAVWALLDAIKRALDDDYNVFLDRERIVATENFTPKIEGQLPTCHCGVIVLSERALERDWVKAEATILGHRHRLPGGFVLCPVLVPPVRSGQLEAFERGSIAQISPVYANLGNPDTTAAEVATALEPVRLRFARSPEFSWETRLQSHLQDAPAAALRNAAAHLDLELDTWPWEADPGGALARRLLELDDLETLFEAVKQLSYDVQGIDARAIYEIAAPCAWIEWAAAGSIVEVADRAGGKRAVALNSKDPLTCSLYVRRASISLKPATPTNVQGELDDEQFLVEARQDVQTALGTVGQGFEDDDTNEQLTMQKVVLVVPHPPPSNTALASVASTFPNLIFFFAGGDTSERTALEGWTRVVDLCPHDPDRERVALKSWRLSLPLLGA